MAQILLVEDEIDLRDNIEIVLTHAGHEVLTAANGREALDVIESSPPDIVVSDISMPVMTGMQMLALVRQTMPALADMPIIFLTALGDKENVVDGRQAGVDDYLTKPVDYQVLTATIDARLARAGQARALKDRQFVKLFKGLTKKREEPPAAESAPSPLVRVAALAEPSLRGRAQLLFPSEFIRDFAKLSPSAQEKALAVMKRIIDDWLTPGDVAADLGAGAVLLALATADLPAAADRFAFLRMRLTQALGGRHSPAAGMDDDGDAAGRGDRFGVDAELKETLRNLHQESARQDADAGTEENGFADVAEAFRIEYEPLWDARTKSYCAFRVGWRRGVGRAALTGSDALLLGDEDPMLCDLTAFAMDVAIRDVMALRGRPDPGREPPIVILPVPLAVFQSMSVYKVERQVEDVASLLDRGRIGFHLTGFNDDAAFGVLRKACAALSRAADLLIVDMDMNFARMERLLSIGCKTLRLDFNAPGAAALGDRARQILLSGVRQAVHAGFDVWAADAPTAAIGRQAILAGAALVSGPAVGAPCPAPDQFPSNQPVGG